MSKKQGEDKKSHLDSKRETVLGQTGSGRNNRGIYIAAVVVMAVISAIGIYVVSLGAGWSNQARTAPGSATAADVAEVAIAATQFDDGQARHFEFDAPDGLKVRFFVVKSSDGVIRAAFDACDVCWRSGLGYQQEGDVMVCRNCGQRFPSTAVNEVQGGCNPAPLNRRMDGDKILIKTADILEGSRFFNL